MWIRGSKTARVAASLALMAGAAHAQEASPTLFDGAPPSHYGYGVTEPYCWYHDPRTGVIYCHIPPSHAPHPLNPGPYAPAEPPPAAAPARHAALDAPAPKAETAALPAPRQGSLISIGEMVMEPSFELGGGGRRESDDRDRGPGNRGGLVERLTDLVEGRLAPLVSLLVLVALLRDVFGGLLRRLFGN